MCLFTFCFYFQYRMVLTVEKVYPCYYDPFCNVMLKGKRNVNGRMESKILYLLQDIKQCSKYLHKYWYNLKYFVRSLHAVYRLCVKFWNFMVLIECVVDLNVIHWFMAQDLLWRIYYFLKNLWNLLKYKWPSLDV